MDKPSTSKLVHLCIYREGNISNTFQTLLMWCFCCRCQEWSLETPRTDAPLVYFLSEDIIANADRAYPSLANTQFRVFKKRRPLQIAFNLLARKWVVYGICYLFKIGVMFFFLCCVIFGKLVLAYVAILLSNSFLYFFRYSILWMQL